MLEHVQQHSAEVVAALNASDKVPFEVVLKPNLITSDVIQATFNEANMDPECAGIITWAHTFSPSKSYIHGLQDLRKPLCQFATQYNEEIPYDSIDMDFMNENQAAHGERELGPHFGPHALEHKVDPRLTGRTRPSWPSSAPGSASRWASTRVATSASAASPTPCATSR